MPLTFAVQPEGLVVPVLVGQGHQATVALLASGKPVQAPLWLTGLIDTGTDVSCLSGSVVQSLGLIPSGHGKTQTVAGSLPVRLFDISLSLPHFGPSPGLRLLHDDLTVMELAQPIPKIDVLIGLDVLLTGKLLLDGPARQFTLDF